jgi:ABC-type Fe3+/spermidine/putrescine transport system ATPase subunit
LVDELRAIIRRVGVTTIFVTHDQAEAFALADHVVVMRAGRIEQDGTPQEVYRQPDNAFVAGFLGFHNLLAGTITEDGLAVDTVLGRLPLAAKPAPDLVSKPYRVRIRPDAGRIDGSADGDVACYLDGTVVAGSFRGGIYRVQFAPDVVSATLLQFDLTTAGGRPLPRVGERVRLGLERDGVLLMAGGEDDQEQRDPIGG